MSAGVHSFVRRPLKLFTFFMVSLIVNHLLSCTSTISPWEVTKYQNTLDAYQKYVSEFPDSVYLQDANVRIDRLSFQQAMQKNTESSLNQYLIEFPGGQFIGDINSALEQLLSDQANSTNDIADYEAYLARFPEGKYARGMRDGLDKAQYREAETLQTVDAFSHYLKQHPKGRYKDEARRAVRVLPLIDACLSRDRQEVLKLKNQGVSLAESDRAALELMRVLKSRMEAYIQTRSGPELADNSTIIVEVGAENSEEILDQFELLLSAGADPNAFRIKGYKAYSVSTRGGVQLLSTGNTGTIVPASSEGMSSLVFSQINGLTEFTKRLLQYGAMP